MSPGKLGYKDYIIYSLYMFPQGAGPLRETQDVHILGGR